MGEKSIERALEVKLQGNELFKKNDFEAAISLYTEAIALCPPGKSSDLSIMYQNRAAALERLDRLDEGLKDCGESLRLNNRYGKSYDRRSKILKKLVDTLDGDKLEERIKHLRQALEDVSVLAQLDGYNPQQLVIVDEILKQLGEPELCHLDNSTVTIMYSGSSLAIVTARTRQPVMPSNYTILQYFSSFIEDPLFENVAGESKYASAKTCFEEKVT